MALNAKSLIKKEFELKQEAIAHRLKSQRIEAIQDAKCGRIRLYANVNLPDRLRQEQTLETISSSLTLTKNHCHPIE